MARRASRGSGSGRLDPELEITDFGPIAGGRIALRPLTILVGPNNSGKTYASVLAHSVLSACADLAAAARSGDWAAQLLEGGELRSLSGRVARLAASGGSGEAAVPPRLAGRIHACTAGRLFGESLLAHMRHNFGSPLGDLVRAGSGSSRIRIRGPVTADVSIPRRGDVAVRVARGGARHRVGGAPAARRARNGSRKAGGALGSGRGGTRPPAGTPAAGRAATEALMGLASRIADPAALAGVAGGSRYLPAARSGVMCAHGALAPGITHSRYGSNGGAMVAGTVSDLVDSLAQARNGPRNGHENGIIPGVFGGRLAGSGHTAGALSYSRGALSVPMHLSSSGVVNTAPLALAAESMGPCDTLVVEEPEAHLHPKSQVTLAGHLVGMVRRGVRVVLSTHSDFLFEQLSILVQLGSIPPQKRRERGYREDDFVRDDEIAPYEFARSARGGHTITEMKHSANDGMDHEGFIKIVESMSNDQYGIYLAREG